jgi:hypothetical protein
MRRWLAVIGFVLCGGVLAVRAQSTPWSAWLYNPNGTMTHITSEGAVLQEVTLPTVASMTYPAAVAVSRGGDYVAYVTKNMQLNSYRLVIYDLPATTILTDYVVTDLLGTDLSLNASPLMYDESDSQFAYGVAQLDGVWRIDVLNVRTGGVLAELRSDMPAVIDAAMASGAGKIPVIWQYQNGEIAFTLQEVNGPPGVEYGSYVWNVASGEVRENTLFPGLDNDRLNGTGEILVPVRDPSLPNNDAAFAMVGGQQNTLQVVDASGRRFPFYNSPDRTLAAPRFIQNGERILTATADAGGNVVWRVIERNGQVVGDVQNPIADVFGLVDGFIYLTATNPSTLMLVNTRDGVDAGTPLGQSTPGVSIQLAWAADSAVPPSAPPYTAWLNLTDVVSVAQVTQAALLSVAVDVTAVPIVTEEPFFVAPTPVMLPSPASFRSQLAVGGRAVVTRAGHAAGLHTVPDDDSPAIVLLYTDMVVDVLDGPNITDGYIWWQVRTRADKSWTGWAIEGAQGAAWLLPVGE